MCLKRAETKVQDMVQDMCLNRALEDTNVLAETETCVLKEPERRQRYEDICPNIPTVHRCVS